MKQLYIGITFLLLLLLPFAAKSQSPATNITFSSVTTNSFTVSWTNGTGVGRIAVIRQSPNAVAFPVDLTVYTASTTFSAGSNLGSANYVIFRGTGNSVSVSGLAANTFYTVTVFEYNTSAAAPNYNTLSYASAGRYTYATEPTTSVSALTASAITNTTATLNWTNGSGTYTLSTVRQSTSNSSLPIDGTSYTTSGTFGSGSAIGFTLPYAYATSGSTGSSVNLSNLSPATNYVAAAYSYNGLLGAQNFKTSSVPVFGFTTLSNAPTAVATNFYARDIEDDAMTISWLNTSTASGGGSNHIVLMSSTSANDLPVDGMMYTANANYGLGSLIGQSYVVYAGTGNAARVANLNLETYYNIRVFEYNGGTGTYNPTTNYLTGSSLPGLERTNTTHPGATATNMTFSGITGNTVTVNWTGSYGQYKIVTARPGKRQTTLGFDGVNDHVVVPYNAALQPSAAVTLECWVNRTNWSVAPSNIEYFAGNAESGGYCLLQFGSLVYAYAYRNGNWGFTAYDIAHLTPGWHHFAVTYDGRYTRGWVDGALYGQDDAGATYPITYTHSNAFIIGADVGTSNTTSGSYTNAQIDEVRVWNVAQSSSLLNTYMNKSLNGNENGLTGYWKFDDGNATTSTAINSEPSTNTVLNGTLTNMTTTAASNVTSTSGWAFSTSPVNCPVDFAGYSYNTNMSSSAPVTVATQTFSVMNAASGLQSTTITGLTPGSWYNFNVFEYDSVYDNTNSSFYTNYLTSLRLSGEVQMLPVTPTISAIAPTSGPIGTVVTITGTNFSVTTSNNIVYFGPTRATVTAATATSLTVVVPFGANYTPVTVAVSGVTATAPREFNVTSVCSATINSSSFTSSTLNTSFAAYEHELMDIDADGKTDVVLAGFSGDVLRTFRGASLNGANPPTFPITNNFTTTNDPYGLEMADVDCDARPDAIILSGANKMVTVHRVTATGSFFIPGIDFPTLTTVTPSLVRAGDIDGDGKLDLVVGYFSGSFISVYRNTGSVGFVSFDPAIHINVGNVSPSSLLVRDMDLDGKADILFGSLTSANFYALRSTSTPAGALTFATQQTFSFASGFVKNMATGDFNLDGKADVLLALSTNTLRLFSNGSTTGSISFTLGNSFATATSGAYSPVCNDLDGDGRQDIILGYEGANTISIWEASGSFGFNPRVDYAMPNGSASLNVTVGDFNADGRSDIAASSVTTAINLLTNTMNALDPEPTVAASAASISGITQNSMTINFTAGSGANRMVIVRQGLSVATLPADGTGYTANSTFGLGSDVGGGGYVVYSGNSNSVTVTGLQSNSFYYFAVVEYNGSSCTSNYLTTPVALANNQTLNTPPTLNAISNPAALCRNPGVQSVSLSGIGTGAANEVQTLSITASSNNTALIPNPTVVYTSPNATGALTYTPVTNATGTATITVTVNDGATNNSTIQRTFVVTVNAPPTTAAAGANQTICTGTATLAANAPTVGTGTWSIAATNNPAITTANLGNINLPTTTLSGLASGNVVTLTWTISNPPCTPSTSNVTITRGTCPLTANFTWSPTSLCATSAQVNTISFTDASFAPSSTITSWSWTFSGPTTPNPTSSSQQNPSNIQFTGPGTFTVTLTVNDNASGNSSITQFVTINPFPGTPGSITGTALVCQGQTNVGYSIPAVSNATSYNWTLPAGATIVSGTGTNSILVNFSTTASSGFVIAQGVNSCGNGISSSPLSVTVLPLPATTTTISGPSSVCQGQSAVVFTTPAAANATGYTWTLPSGATISSGNNTTSITVNFSGTAQSGPVTVVGTNSCGTGATTASFNLTVNPLPDAAGSITSSQSGNICQGATGVVYSVAAIANASSYTWVLPAGASIVSGAGTNAISVNFSAAAVSGTVTVSGVNSCGSGTPATLPITITALPGAAGAILGTDTVCQGQFGVSFFVSSIPNAGSYVWSLPAGATIITGANTESITVDFGPNAVSGPITVYAQNSCGAGTISAPLNITVNPLPAAAGTLTGPSTVCQGQTGVSFSIPVAANATGYSWILPPGATITSGNNTNSITVDFSTSAVGGSVLVAANNACGSGLESDTINLVVNPLPDAPGAITGFAVLAICPTPTGRTYSVPAIANATTYVWTLPAGANIVSGNGTNTIVVDFTPNALSGLVQVFGQNACGNGDTATLNINFLQVTPVDICLVTVDNNSQFNNIVWEKPLTTDIDSFRIYREITTNNYVPIGAVDYDSLSVYIDSVYVPLANPNTTFHRYKIASVDSCGNESVQGPHHRTLFLQANVGIGGVVNLNWSLYEGAVVSYYRILRDSTNSGIWQVIDSVSGNTNLYTDNNPPQSVAVSNIRYKLQTVWLLSCNPTRTVVTSESNLKDIAVTLFSVAEVSFTGQVNVYPNPSEGDFTITCPYSQTGYRLEVFNALGQIVYQQDIESSSLNRTDNRIALPLGHLATGSYYLVMRDSANRTARLKLMVE